LLLVLDEERRQSLEKTRVNHLISPFGMTLTPDTEYLHNTGAVAKASEINKADRHVPYSGGRAVLGGTPFAYQLDKEGAPSRPFGAYTRLDSGGRIVVLGEGMASLFLGEPKAVRLLGDPGGSTTYWGPDSAVFMTEVLAWLSSRADEPDLTKVADSAVWRVHNRSATSVPEQPGAVRLDARAKDGMVWLVDSDFSEGTIEIDLRGSNTPGRSFVGLALRGVDDVTYDVVYFRPFNFKNPDEPRRARAVQYVSMPPFPWERLRAESPGKYEAAVDPVPDPDGWFHARIVVRNRQISAYVDGAASPSLVVAELSDRRGGRLGLWVGHGSDGAFANLRVTPDR
jgi:hypothetical protein